MSQQQIEYGCKDVVFHFNKKHLEDSDIPMWVIKTHGESFYVNHVSAEIPWSTKETPDNSHTKGSLKFKECLLVIDENNEATIKKLTLQDKWRLRNQKLGITRVIFNYGSEFHKALQNNELKHSPFKNVRGGCGTSFVVCDLLEKAQVTFAALKYEKGFRIMSANEQYYQAYDDNKTYIESTEDDYYLDYEDEDDE